MATTPTTKLEAVNQMLRGINEAPVSTLVGEVDIDVTTAIATLDTVVRDVNLEGWLYNTEHCYPLTRDINNEISIPSNALKIDVQRQGVDPVQRGTKLYDRENHTFIFSDNLEATIVLSFAFEELPQSARHYITYRAVRQYQRDAVGRALTDPLTEEGEYRARAVFTDDQATDEDLNMLDTPGFETLR